MDLQEFFTHTEPGPDGCLNWTDRVDKSGYAICFVRGFSTRRASRFAWFLAYGKFPEHTIEHNCKNRLCVNVAHLQDWPQSRQSETAVSYWGAKTHCPKGHEYAGDNLLVKQRSDGTTFRQCRECQREYLHKKRGPEKAVHRGPRRST